MQYRRIRIRDSDIGPTALLGLGLGLAAGFLLGELYSSEGAGRRIGGLRAGRRRQPARGMTAESLTVQVQGALLPTLGDDARGIELMAVGRSAVEVHGWVPSRRARVSALTTVREIVGPERQLVDRLLVAGEDDLPGPRLTSGEEL